MLQFHSFVISLFPFLDHFYVACVSAVQQFLLKVALKPIWFGSQETDVL